MRKELSIIARIYPYLIAVIICYGIYWLYGPCYSTKDINEEKKNASVIIEALEKYYNDHKKYPLYLDELISSCYLEQIPECKIGKDKKFNYRISKKNNFQEFMLSFSTNGHTD
ncbi:MAG: hypothetical protein HY762_08380 [Planctomycetes bacterium]|nr:hypothetical protein [Planctomycetota bacterium]